MALVTIFNYFINYYPDKKRIILHNQKKSFSILTKIEIFERKICVNSELYYKIVILYY